MVTPAVIDDFRGRWGFLNNFALAVLVWEGIEYPTSEHAFNAGKSMSVETRRWIAAAPTPREAKARGRRVPLRPDWDARVRYQVMASVLRAKFLCRPERVEAPAPDPKSDAAAEIDALMREVIDAHTAAYHPGRPCRENERGECWDRFGGTLRDRDAEAAAVRARLDAMADSAATADPSPLGPAQSAETGPAHPTDTPAVAETDSARQGKP